MKIPLFVSSLNEFHFYLGPVISFFLILVSMVCLGKLIILSSFGSDSIFGMVFSPCYTFLLVFLSIFVLLSDLCCVFFCKIFGCQSVFLFTSAIVGTSFPFCFNGR